MEKVSGAKVNGTLFAGLYGQAKMRKTTTALMAPAMFRPIGYLDADKGAALRLRLLSMLPEQRSALQVKEVMPPGSGPWCAEGIDFFYPDAKNFFSDCWDFASVVAPQYKLVVIDTGTTVAVNILDEVKRTEYSGTRDGTKRMSMQTGLRTTVHPTQGDYNVAQDRFREFVTMLDASSAHVLLLFHERTGEVRDAEGVKRIIAGPRTVGVALLEQVPAVLDVIVRLETRAKMIAGKLTNEIIMRTRNHNIYIAGDRSGMFEDEQPFEPEEFWRRIGGLISLGHAATGAAKSGA